ncbi:MAG: formimidoylglutamase [Bacteroidales bacterium]|nr:formimidoylglutamase [Bacteroidales bacterium]MBR5028776.1 formimidoylglutamase [Bacteroidales bacterium]
MDLSTYFEPVSYDDIRLVHSDFFPNIGDRIQAYTTENGFPDIKKQHIALFGVCDDRRSVNNSGCDAAPDEVRKKFYNLSLPSYDMKIVDLGNMVKGNTPEDTYFALTEVVATLLHHNIVPIVIGGGNDLAYAIYKAYEKLGQIINICGIDPRFDLGPDEGELNSQSYLTKIITSQPNFLFNFTNIGYQSYLVDKQYIKLMNDLHFDAFRLGVIQNSINESEPLLRNADFVSVDMASVRQSDAPANGNPTPHGFYGEQLCAMARFAGISDKLTCIGFFELNPRFDINGQSAHLVSHAIWYFIEGFYSRNSDFPYKDKHNYRRYIVPMLDNESIQLVFYKSKKSERWWMEIPCPTENHDKYARHLLLPCSYRDYQQALENEIPERWWTYYNRMMV